jgi:CRP-like cAMP-binding protein
VNDYKVNIQPIIDHFANYAPLDEEEINALATRLTERQIKRKQFILNEGDRCNHYTFVVKGCIRMYKVDKKGNEHNLQFCVENDWVGDIGSFHDEKPSELNIEAMEPSVILQIAKPDLIYLYIHYLTFNRNFRVLVERAFVSLQKRLLQTISSTAEERYVDFLIKHPDLFNRISNVQIASYLGVTPEFLSKIRKDIASK